MIQLTQYDIDRLKKSAKNVNKILKEYSDLSYCRYIDHEVQQVVVKKGTKLYPYTYKEYEQKIQDLTKRYLFEIGVQKTILNGSPFDLLFMEDMKMEENMFNKIANMCESLSKVSNDDLRKKRN